MWKLVVLAVGLLFGGWVAAAQNNPLFKGCSAGDLQGAGESACLARNMSGGPNENWVVTCDPGGGQHFCCHGTANAGGGLDFQCEPIPSEVRHSPANAGIPASVLIKPNNAWCPVSTKPIHDWALQSGWCVDGVRKQIHVLAPGPSK